ncbi:unnamed protein product [Prorocentrum cordatum]|uniref:Uncharacterized protein n=1 Tax=Prorocentrum cordatum TaxID=2364126 RepID=A0ABN9UYG4_9DINO|nr:unnamed protein product [Polarella glacialis]
MASSQGSQGSVADPVVWVTGSSQEDQDFDRQAVRASWTREPICTSIIIVFWQRYLCELAAATQGECAPSLSGLDLILQWMPLKADRGLPGDLLGVLRSRGWACVSQVPRVFRPALILQQAPAPAACRALLAAASPQPAGPAALTTPGSGPSCCSDFATGCGGCGGEGGLRTGCGGG